MSEGQQAAPGSEPSVFVGGSAATASATGWGAELPTLTGLRFCAAFSILGMHTTEWCVGFNNTDAFNLIAALIGLIGMPLFFVLSGFVIHYNYGRHFRNQPLAVATRNFLAARFSRIYPLFFFFCVFGIISDFMANWLADYPGDFWSFVFHSLTLTQSWVYQIVVNNRLLLFNGFGLSWSLSCEFFFYLSYLLFVFGIIRLKKPRETILSTIIYSCLVIIIFMFCYLHGNAISELARPHLSHFIARDEDEANSFYRWLFYYSPYARIWEFILGCLTAQLFLLLRDRPVSETEQRRGALLLHGAIALLTLYDIRYVWDLHHHLDTAITFFSLNFGCAIPLAVIIFCSARYKSPVTTLLSRSWIVWLGEISYSIYAVHTWTVRPFIRPVATFTWPLGIDAVLRIAFAIGFTIIVSSATYAIIEVPCRRYFRNKLMRSPSVARAPLSAAVEKEA